MQSCSYWNYQVSMRFCSWLKASSIRGLNSILPLQISIINHVIFFPSLQFPNNICMSTETVAVHNERSDTFNGTDSSLWRGTKGECWLSLTQLFRRLQRLMVMRLTIEIECEIYLTRSIECMLPDLIHVRLVVISSSKMKYLPDDNLLYSLFKHDTSTKRQDQHCRHKAAKLTICEFTRGCKPRGAFHNNDCAKVSC